MGRLSFYVFGEARNADMVFLLPPPIPLPLAGEESLKTKTSEISKISEVFVDIVRFQRVTMFLKLFQITKVNIINITINRAS